MSRTSFIAATTDASVNFHVHGAGALTKQSVQKGAPNAEENMKVFPDLKAKFKSYSGSFWLLFEADRPCNRAALFA